MTEENPTGFDTSVNTTYHENIHDSSTGIVSTITGGITASVVGAAASIWNSLPGTAEVDTRDLIGRVSNNALAVYDENPDVIDAASFIGGSLIPGTIAFKGMQAARAGTKAVNWFSAAGKAEDTAQVANLVARGAQGTTEYRNLVRGIYAKTAVNQAIDAAAAEAAILLTFNASPLMEDYMKDPVQNFAIGVALGGVLGTGIGLASDHFLTKTLAGKITAEASENIRARLGAVPPDATSAAALQINTKNAMYLQEIIDIGIREGKTVDTDLTMSLAQKRRELYVAETNAAYDTIVSKELRESLTLKQNQELKDLIANTDSFTGAVSVSAVRQSDMKSGKYIKGKGKETLSEESILGSTESKFGPTKPTNEAVYFQEESLYGTAKDIVDYGGAATLGKTEKQLAKEQGKNFGKIGEFDTALEMQVMSAPDLQGALVGKFSKLDGMKAAEFSSLKVASNDTQFLEAALAKMVKDPEAAAKGIKLASEANYANAVAVERLVSPEKYTFANATNILNYVPWKGQTAEVTRIARDIVNSWKGASGMQDFRLAAAEFTRGGFTAKSQLSQAGQNFKAIYESPGSLALRAEFDKVADADGFVYLWRGTRTDKDRSAVRSYTTLQAKAGEFGTPRLYKISTKDIIAGFTDGGPTGQQVEILVLEGQRLPVNLSAQGKTLLRNQKEGLDTKTLGIDEVRDLIAMNKVVEIEQLLKNGVPIQSIAKKTNSTVEAVYQVASGEKIQSEFLSKIKTIEDARAALDNSKKPLLLRGDIRKNSYASAIGNNYAKMTKEISDGIIMAELSKSTMPEIQGIVDIFLMPGSEGGAKNMLDVMSQALNKANASNTGNFFTQSADFAMRNLGDLGPAVSYVGGKITTLKNNLNQTITKPIADAMTLASKSPVATIEMNTLKEVNAGLDGWRGFKDNKLVQYSYSADGKKLFDSEGNPIYKVVQFNGKDYEVSTPEIIKVIAESQAQGKKLLELSNVQRRIKGLPDSPDIGFWLPSFNPVNKFISYVHDISTDKVSLLSSNSLVEHETLVREFKQRMAAEGRKDIKVYMKGGPEQANWSAMNGRLDTITMKQADTSMKKSGSSASAIIPSGTQVYTEIEQGFEHYINSQVRNIMDLTMNDVTSELRKMSQLNTYGFDNQPLSAVKKITQKPSDPAAKIRNILLGDSNLGEYEGWKSVNTTFETGLSMAVGAVSTIWDSTVKPLKTTFFGGKKELTAESVGKIDFEKLYKDMNAEGIRHQWENMDYEAAKKMGYGRIEDVPDTSKRLIYASNALAATMALRFAELAQPLVNMMSLPILTGLAIANRMPESFLGIQKGTAKVGGVQIMFEGARASADPQFAHWGKQWEIDGYFKPYVSEANDTARLSRQFDNSKIGLLEKGINSSIVNVMSKPADMSEVIVRRQTMYTGAVLAKRLYPGLDDKGITIFAKDFMDKALGNFNSSQRPVFFQGSMGVALGMFQTYSLTLGQSIYRHLELKNYKALGIAGLTQAGIFGAGSVPGFKAVSNMIGEYYSDSNVDLTTGTYRAIGDEAATTVLYGLPSLAGLGTNTRGDANFRIPGITGDNIVALNFAKQGVAAISSMADSLGKGSNSAQAFGEALSLQSMSRPLARGAELLTGNSITRAGNVVQTPEEVYTASGIIARVMSTRPIAEIKLRDADHLNKYYGAIDRDNRQDVVKQIRTAIRNGNLTDELISSMGEKYFRNNGTPTGWQSAVNTAIAQEEVSGKEIFAEKLKPNNPIMYMIDKQDGF